MLHAKLSMFSRHCLATDPTQYPLFPCRLTTVSQLVLSWPLTGYNRLLLTWWHSYINSARTAYKTIVACLSFSPETGRHVFVAARNVFAVSLPSNGRFFRAPLFWPSGVMSMPWLWHHIYCCVGIGVSEEPNFRLLFESRNEPTFVRGRLPHRPVLPWCQACWSYPDA